MRISANRIDLDDKVLQKPVLRDYAEELVVESAGLTYTVDCTQANVFRLTLTADCTFTFSNPPASGTAGTITLILVQDSDGSRTVTWPASVDWPGGTAPTLATTANTGTDIITFITTDAGTTWRGVHAVADVETPLVQELWMWGVGNYGRLGVGDTAHRSSPVQVGALTDWASVSVGRNHSLSIKTDSTLWAWGFNSSGQLGLGDTPNRSSPVQVGALTTWAQVSGGNAHTMAVKTDGTLWAWGGGSSGQLGLNDTATNRSSPVQVGALTTWSKVASGDAHTMAVKTDGTLWAWGYGGTGQLGLGDTPHRSSPIQVGALTTWSQVSAGYRHSLAVKTDGTLWAWGRNDNGQLGLGDTANRSSPVQVGALTTWSSVSAGRNHTAAIRTDGTLWAWGVGALGRLGDGATTNRSSPVQVGALTTWMTASAGGYHTLAIRLDGTLWAWGYSPYGVLGTGAAGTSHSSPVQIGALTTWAKIDTGHIHTMGLKRP